MSTPTESQSSRERTWIYVTSCVILGVMVLIAVIAFSSARESARAGEKADELIAALQDAGAVRTPDRDQIIRVLGDDGGATCENPNDALSRATFLSQLTNGATGPGYRPVIANARVAVGQLAIIKVYCPDQLAEFQEFIDDLKTSTTGGA